MTEATSLLHNMSAPPRSMVRYAGLANIGPTLRGDAIQQSVFGRHIAFRFPETLRRRGAKYLVSSLGGEPGSNPEQALIDMIEIRVTQLALPDACLVVREENHHPAPWPDLLAAITIITKASDRVWLRSKTPRLTTLRKTAALSLLVPPGFADCIGGIGP